MIVQMSDLGLVIRIRGQWLQAHLLSHQYDWEERVFSGCGEMCVTKNIYTCGRIRRAVASPSQQRTCLPCVTVAGKGPPLILPQEYLRGEESFSTWQCSDRASLTTSPPVT